MTMITRMTIPAPRKRIQRLERYTYIPVRMVRVCAHAGMPLPKGCLPPRRSAVPNEGREGERSSFRATRALAALFTSRRRRRSRHHATCFSPYAEWRTRLFGQLRLSLVPPLDALARRACRNGAPILLRFTEAVVSSISILFSRLAPPSGSAPPMLIPDAPSFSLLLYRSNA